MRKHFLLPLLLVPFAGAAPAAAADPAASTVQVQATVAEHLSLELGSGNDGQRLGISTNTPAGYNLACLTDSLANRPPPRDAFSGDHVTKSAEFGSAVASSQDPVGDDTIEVQRGAACRYLAVANF